jgi:hypothetical protein
MTSTARPLGPFPRSLLPRQIRSGPVRSLERRSPPLASTHWRHQTRFPPLIEAGFPGNPLVSILKPPKPVTSGFPAGDFPFPGASKPTSVEVASLRGEPARRRVPLGTGSAHPRSSFRRGMGGGELLFTP